MTPITQISRPASHPRVVQLSLFAYLCDLRNPPQSVFQLLQFRWPQLDQTAAPAMAAAVRSPTATKVSVPLQHDAVG